MVTYTVPYNTRTAVGQLLRASCKALFCVPLPIKCFNFTFSLVPLRIRTDLFNVWLPAGLSKQGLFRIPATEDRMRRIQSLIEQPETTLSLQALEQMLENETSLDLACVLKRFLQQLPEPLLTTQHRVAYLQIASKYLP